MKMKTLPIDWEAILRVLILWGFSLWLYYLWATGALYKYVHPRFFKLTLVASGVFLLLTMVQVFRTIQVMLLGHLGHGTHNCSHQVTPAKPRGRTLSYLVFLLPLILGMLLPPQALDPAMAVKKGFTMQASSQQKDIAASPEVREVVDVTKVEQQINVTDQATFQGQDADAPSEVPEVDSSPRKKDRLKVTDSNFVEIADDFWLEPYKHLGREIEAAGFVYKDDDMTRDQFVVGRFMISCCVADAVVTGFLCQFPGAPELPVDSWVKVKGQVVMGEYCGEPMATIEVTTAEPIPAPEDSYVYP